MNRLRFCHRGRLDNRWSRLYCCLDRLESNCRGWVLLGRLGHYCRGGLGCSLDRLYLCRLDRLDRHWLDRLHRCHRGWLYHRHWRGIRRCRRGWLDCHLDRMCRCRWGRLRHNRRGGLCRCYLCRLGYRCLWQHTHCGMLGRLHRCLLHLRRGLLRDRLGRDGPSRGCCHGGCGALHHHFHVLF